MKYSNCLIEAVKAKIKDPKNVSIRMYPASINNGQVHFYWVNVDTFYHYTHKNKNEKFLFKGETKNYRKVFFDNLMLHKMYVAKLTVDQAVKLAKKCRLPFTKDDIEFSFRNEELD